MIGVCDLNGFISEACEVVKISGSGDDVGTVDRARFELFVQEKLLPVLGNYSLGESRSLVIIDNATIHHSDEIINMIEGKGAKILYLPPYSPDLNPIELMFAVYKRKVCREAKYYDWVVSHLHALDSVTPASAKNMFRCGIRVCDDIDSKKAIRVIVIVLLVLQVMKNNNIY